MKLEHIRRLSKIMLVLMVLTIAWRIAWESLRIPDYPEVAYPEGWTPAPQKWDTSWDRVKKMQAHYGRLELLSVLPGTGSYWFSEQEDFYTPLTLRRFDCTTRSIEAEMTIPQGRTVLHLTQDGIGVVAQTRNDAPWFLTVYDSFTFTQRLAPVELDVTNLLACTEEDWQPTAAICTPDGILLTTVRMCGENGNWVEALTLFDWQGKRLSDRLMPAPGWNWTPYPIGKPTLWVGSKGWPSVTTTALDLLTFESRPAPVIDRSSRGYFDVIERVPTNPQDKFLFSIPAESENEYGMEIVVTKPQLFEQADLSYLLRGSPEEKKRMARIQQRQKLWRLIYSPEELAAAQRNAIAIDQVLLRRAGERVEERPLTGEFLLSLKVEKQSEGPGEQHPIPEWAIRTRVQDARQNVQFHTGLPAGLIVTQILRTVPDEIDAPMGLLRIGLLADQGSEVQWLGWMQCPHRVPFVGFSYLSQIHLARDGDSLVVWLDDQDVPTRPAGICVTEVPLPEAFRELPEGYRRDPWN